MTKELRHYHSDPAVAGEESLVLLLVTRARRKNSEVFPFAQHDRIMAAGEIANDKRSFSRVHASSLVRHSTFRFRLFAAAPRPRSHMLDHVIPELRALDLRRAIHQAREVVRDAFALDRTA